MSELEKLRDKIIEELSDADTYPTTSGDDRFENAWQEFAYQIQDGESMFFEAYEATIRQICGAELREEYTRTLMEMWLETDAGDDLADDETPGRQQMIHDIVDKVYDLVSSEAADLDLEEILYPEEESEDEEDEDEEEIEDSTETIDEVSEPKSPPNGQLDLF